MRALINSPGGLVKPSRNRPAVLHPGLRALIGCILCLTWAASDASADAIGFSTAETSKYLLIGTGTVGAIGDAVHVSNRALNGDIAVTKPNGDITLSNIKMTGTVGIATAQTSYSAVTNGISNSTFNNSPFSSSNGIQINTNFSGLNSDLSTAKTWINGLAATQTRTADIKGNFTFELQAGLNVIDLGVSGSDFKMEGDGAGKETVTIKKAAGVTEDAVAIFRVVNGKGFNTSQVIIDNQSGHGNVLFYSASESTSGSIQAFNLSNMRTYAGNTPGPNDVPGILNVAFWALGMNAEININNALGCTQLVADKINLNNVHFDLCAFDMPGTVVIPLPAAAWSGLALMGVLGVSKLRRFHRHPSML